MTRKLLLLNLVWLACFLLLVCQGWTQEAKPLFLTEKERTWLKQHRVLRVSGPQAFPPFQWVDDKGRYQGLASDYLEHIGTLLGLRLEYLPPTPWSTILELLKKRELDVLTCAAQAADRQQYLSYATPHLIFPLVIITRKNSPFIGGIDDLQNRNLAIIPGNATESWLKESGIFYHPHEVDSPVAALKAVSLGKADAAIENLGAATYLIEQTGLTNLQVAAPTPYEDYTLSIAVRSDWPELIGIFNKSLAAITPQEHQQLRQRWIGVRYEHGLSVIDIIKWVVIVVLVSAVVILFFLRSNSRLKREVTERKRFAARLRESERKIATLISNLPGMVYRCSNTPDSPMQFVSEGCLAICGYHPAALGDAGEQVFDALVHVEDRQNRWNQIQQAIERNKPYELEYRIIDRAGSLRWVWERGRAVVVEDGHGIVLEGFITDITEERETRRRLQQSQKMEAIGTLAGGIAHDFNNILHAILGYTELLAADLEPESRLQSDVGEIKHAALRAAGLIKQILTFSRQDERSIQPLDPVPIIRETLKMLHATLPKTVTIEEYIDTKVLPVNADPTGLQQLVLNLITNALHALERQKGVIRVRVCSMSTEDEKNPAAFHGVRGKYTILEVEDSGCGIPHSIRDKIFEPYFTTKEMGAGTGLGLAAVHGIVEKYGGRITVESVVGEGSRFTISLPALPPASEPETECEQPASPIVADSQYDSRRAIMVVEDEQPLRDILRRHLQRAGYRVEIYRNGSEALTAFVKAPHNYGLVLTDQTMPKMTGGELAAAILAIDAQMPILLCTGHSETIGETEALAMGIRGFIHKPIEKQILLQNVAELLR